MANYPQELAQDAVCQSYTGHMTGLWFLPTRLLRLNTNGYVNQVTVKKCPGNVFKFQLFTHKVKTPALLETSTRHFTQTTHLPQADVPVASLSPGAQLSHETTLLAQPL